MGARIANNKVTNTTDIKEQAPLGGEVSSKVDRAVSWLGLEMGELRLLVNLADVVEVIPVPPMQNVPLVKPWFRGASNVRGSLYSVTDLAHFLTLAPTVNKPSSRVLLLNSVQATQSAILVDGVLGLKNIATLRAVSPALKEEVQAAANQLNHVIPKMAPKLSDREHFFTNECYQDEDGRLWLTLSIDALTRDAEFINPSIV